MKKICLLLIFIFLNLLVFSQDVPDNIIQSYQDEIHSWIIDNDINISSQLIDYDGIELYSTPYLFQKYPNEKYIGRVDFIDCFAIGKFLTINESDIMHPILYSCILESKKNAFLPFKNFDNFKNSIIFNVNILFDKPMHRGLNSDYNGNYIYLIVYFNSFYSDYPDNVFIFQLTQIKNGNNKNIIIFPYSFYYALFRIDTDSNIELVKYYGIN
jgi:hypothetical protein